MTDYSGMTLNERLFAAGLMDQFDAAQARRDRHSLLALLRQVDVSAPDAIVRRLLGQKPREEPE